MARRTKEPERRQARLSSPEMQAAIGKIDRRLADIDAFDVNSVNDRGDPRINALSSTLDALLVSIFGHDTVEYERYRWPVTSLDTASLNMMYVTPIHEVREGLQHGMATARSQLEAIRAGFVEELEDAGVTSTGKTLKAYEGLELHPAIERAAGKLFRDGHYANAIVDAVRTELGTELRLPWLGTNVRITF